MPVNRTNTFVLDEFLGCSVAAFRQAFIDISERIDPNCEPDDDSILDELTEAVHRSREECRLAGLEIGQNPVLLKQAQVLLREAVAPWCDQSWFVHRAKTKPCGYPGDYVMLTAIYDQQIKTRGIGGYLDRYFLETDLARAVRSRLAAVKRFLIDKARDCSMPLNVLNVASGPGREYRDEFQEVASRIHLTCVDADQRALDYLRTSVESQPGMDLDLNCVCYNALKMTSARKNLEVFGESDFTYSVGLCDYIPDRFLIKMLNGWRESLSPSGTVYVAFKDCRQYVAAEYQWHVDWHFFERTEDDCRRIFSAAGFDVDKMSIARDETGIILNFIAGPDSIRYGQPQPADQEAEFASAN